jgi:hypothetical protein
MYLCARSDHLSVGGKRLPHAHTGEDTMPASDQLNRGSRCRVDTVATPAHEEDFITYTAGGKKSGHGTRVWLWAPEYAMEPMADWRPVQDPPVIALLDTEIHDHSGLPAPAAGTPFLLPAPGYDLPDVTAPPAPDRVEFGRFWGHGTFIAGLIRRHAPGAQVLSLPVMDQHGEVDENRVLAALRWLTRYQAREHRRMVVLMAFGREAATDDPQDDPGLRELAEAIGALASLGVPVVASAGNERSERPRWPAAFATDPDLSGSVVSVGASLSPTERAPFSNFGVWVREWRPAASVVSLMPLAPEKAPHIDSSNFAYWGGTSFAAAVYAGELADRLGPDRSLGAPGTGH